MPQLIGICGPLGAGKTTAANMLVLDFGFTRMRMADTLKNMLRTAGLTYAQIDGDQKEIPCDFLLGHTPRFAMQTLGTEWARDCIGEDFWVNCMKLALSKLPPNELVVIDDIRFPNEAEMVEELGGRLFRVENAPRVAEKPSFLHRVAPFLFRNKKNVHASEAYWTDFEVDYQINNYGSLEDLRQLVHNAYWGDTHRGP